MKQGLRALWSQDDRDGNRHEDSPRLSPSRRRDHRIRKPISVRDNVLLFGVAFLWALCYPLIDTGLSAAPPLRFGGIRAALAGIVLWALCLITRRPMPRGLGIWGGLIGVGLSATAVGFAGMFLAGGQISPGLATVLANTQPLIAAVIAGFVLHESLKGRQAVALAAGFTGVIVIATPGFLTRVSNASLTGILYVLMGAAGVALGNVFLKRLAGRVDPYAAMACQLLIGALPLLLLSWLIEPHARILWSVPFLFSLGVLSIFSTALVFVLWFTLLERYELNRVNAYTFLSPAIALGLGAAFYSERLSAMQWAGVALVLVAAGAASRQASASCPAAVADGGSGPGQTADEPSVPEPDPNGPRHHQVSMFWVSDVRPIDRMKNARRKS